MNVQMWYMYYVCTYVVHVLCMYRCGTFTLYVQMWYMFYVCSNVQMWYMCYVCTDVVRVLCMYRCGTCTMYVQIWYMYFVYTMSLLLSTYAHAKFYYVYMNYI